MMSVAAHEPSETAKGGPPSLKDTNNTQKVGSGDPGRVWEHYADKLSQDNKKACYGCLPPVVGWVGENWTRVKRDGVVRVFKKDKGPAKK